MPGDWHLAEPVEVSPDLRMSVGGHPLVAQLLAQRGIAEPHAALAFIDPARYAPAPSEALPGLIAAVELIERALSADWRIRVWGDFDADGLTATALLVESLAARGARVDYGLPSRRDGHGLPGRAVDEALYDGVQLLVTCDTGIRALEQVKQAVAGGLGVIVTDHHDLPQVLPPAHAVIDPKMLPITHPLRELSGVGVAFKLAESLLGQASLAAPLSRLLDLVALGMIADVAQSVSDVRYLIQRGIGALRTTERPGLCAMMEIAGLPRSTVDEEDIGYQLAPRLNAAGRLGDAEWVVRFLISQDESDARVLAERLEALNVERRALTSALTAQVEHLLASHPELCAEPALVLDGDGWEPGMLGLVAGHLVQQHGKPAVLVAHRHDLPSVASARSVEGIDIHGAIAAQAEHLLQHGGHPMAAGFTVDRSNLDVFRRGLLHWLRERPTPPDARRLTIDAPIPWPEVNLRLAREIGRLKPFGAGNSSPVLMLGGATLIRTEDVGRQGDSGHYRLYVNSDEGLALDVLWFNAHTLPELGERIELAFTVGVNRWQGRERPQLTLVDWRPALSIASTRWTAMVSGREVVDWRGQEDALELVRELRASQGHGLVVWAEADDLPGDLGARTRATLHDRAPALAILTAPPGPDALTFVLRVVQPQAVYLLPPWSVPSLSPDAVLRHVAGMLRVALRRYGGRLDTLRMASRLGVRQATVVTALCGLEASGRIRLEQHDDGLVAHLLEDAHAEEPSRGGDDGASSCVGGEAENGLSQARAALAHLVRETLAYRRAYVTQPLGALFPPE